jgi:hypothetical protein
MLTDEQLIYQIRIRLQAELAALDPPDELLQRLRERALEAGASHGDQGDPSAHADSSGGLSRVWRAGSGHDRRRSRILTGLGIVISVLTTVGVVVIAGAALVLLHHSSSRSPGSTGHGASGLTLSDPKSLVVVSPLGTDSAVVELRSPVNGKVQNVLGTFHPPGPAGAFFDGGLALSPNGQDLYLAFPGKANQLIERIAVTGHKPTIIAEGEQPAVSPNGRLLAYAAGGQPSETIAVRDLASGTTSSIRLGDLLGGQADLSDGDVTWLDGSDIAVVPGQMPPFRKPASGATRSGPRSCSSLPSSAACLLVIQLTSSGHPLTAHSVVVPDVKTTAITISADPSNPQSLFLAANEWNGKNHDRMNVYRITLRGPVARVKAIGSIPDAQPLTFDLVGKHLLYLTLTSPANNALPVLWNATLAQDRLMNPGVVLRNAEVQEAAW